MSKSKIKLCQCGNIISARNKKCHECKEKEKERKRWKLCKCGFIFKLEVFQGGGNRVCPQCKNEDYLEAHDTIMLFFDKPRYSFLPIEKRIRKFANKQRNIIQASTDYAEFKLYNINFSSVSRNSKTWDHINAMTYIIENYISECISEPIKKDFSYFRGYLLKYAVQFRVTKKQNMELIKYQRTGITPKQYISVVGNMEGKTEVESIKEIEHHFINKN